MKPDSASSMEVSRRGAHWIADEGEGRPVVCIHGAPGSIRDFRWLTPALVEAGLRSVRMDLPGFGRAPPQASHGVRFLAGQVEAALETLVEEPVILLGHSMGGLLAASVAARRPDLVDGLALVSTPGLTAHAVFRRGRRRLEWTVAGPWTRRIFSPLLAPTFRAAGFTAPYPTETLVSTLRLIASVDFDRHAKNLRRVRQPTLVAYTTDDPLIETEIFEVLEGVMPPGPRLRFSDGGHNPQKHYATEIAASLSALPRDR